MQPNHPNWTGKTYRTSRDAFNGRQYRAPQRNRRIWWLVVVAALTIGAYVLGTTWR